MQGKVFSGMYEIASQFPPSVNTADDPSRIKPYESPACYGVDLNDEGRLSAGSIPTGVTRDAPIKTIGGTVYDWFYNRLWRANGVELKWGAPYYDGVYFPHGLGKIHVDNAILGLFRAFNSQLWLVTAKGSYFITNARSKAEEDFEPSQFVQELKTSAKTYAMTLGEKPVVSNTSGVFMYDGGKTTELTRAVRDSLGSFTAVAIKADYEDQRIIGTAKFVIDVQDGKLYDYGTTGFLYTTPTMAQPAEYKPFVVNTIAFTYEMTGTDTKTIQWQSKAEDQDWHTEDEIDIIADDSEQSRKEVEIGNPNRSAHKYVFRITGLSDNISIRSIHVNVEGLAVEGDAK